MRTLPFDDVRALAALVQHGTVTPLADDDVTLAMQHKLPWLDTAPQQATAMALAWAPRGVDATRASRHVLCLL